jgi:hypothetical protein
MTGRRTALLFLDAVVIGAVLGYLVAPYVKRAACALVAAGQARNLDAEWAALNLEENRGGLS